MNRREFAKIGALGLAAAGLAAAGRTDAGEPEEQRRAAVCGLFCDACSEKAKGRCHGCGCDCGKCNASKHKSQCSIYTCAEQRGLLSCADCKDLPCSKLIMHTCDPLFLTSAPCIENLRRRKAIGTAKWIEEQQAYWTDEDHLRKQHFAEAKGQAEIRELKKKTGYKKLW